MIPAEDNCFRTRFPDFQNNCRIIYSTWSYTFIKNNFCLAGFFQVFLGKFSKSFTIVTFIVNNCNLGVTKRFKSKLHINFCLSIIGGNSSKEVRIIATLSQSRICGRWRHDQYTFIFIYWQSCFGSTGTDMTENNFSAF